MIDDKFKPEAFKKAAPDEEALDKLCADLSIEVQWKLHQALEEYMAGVVSQLNQMGHNLVGSGYQDMADFSYRDDYYDDFQNYKCRMRFSLDARVSTYCYENQQDE